ncbi:glyoxal oxidase [Ceratobasidium sp. AG-Ba]|nr:glyoxal oxidase [Ceratobasidium sp. AG-Ba]
MTVDSCVSACATRAYAYAGAEYANECYCGNAFAGASTGGGSVPPESECNMPCPGDSSQICGAGNRLSVYTNGQAQPGVPVLPNGWSSAPKCITEASTGRALVGNSLTSQSMTLDQCIDLCDQTGFQYAGAEYGAECYCSNTISTANGGGVEVPASDCNMNCGGNSQQKCGAGYRITLYTKNTATNPLPTGWIKNFCTVDQDARVLSGYSFTDNSGMTPNTCISACAQRNFMLAGVENGSECYCGNTINQALPTKDADCKKTCAGDDSQYCGGGWRLMVYIKVPDTPSEPNSWSLTPGGSSGVVMTHIAVTTNDTVLVIDRKENNPLLKANGKPAWGAVWNLVSNTARPLDIVTHSFCSSGNFLSNGTLANFGGHPYTDRSEEQVSDGQQGIRLYNPCPASQNCGIYENPTRIRLTSNRWYPSSARLHDGSVIIIGGQVTAGWTNDASVNNPTYEFFPAKNINGYNGLQIPSQFFKETLPHNTFPHLYALPSKKLFVAANNQAMLLDWENNVETRLPNFPNGQRVVYPLNSAGVLLPLTPANNYTPEVLICGGSHISDKIQAGELDAHHDYASAQCSRMALDSAGIAAGWKVEYMPEPRVMPDGVILPNGKILIVNGGRTGTAGYGNLQYRIGDSNADNPTLTPLLYDPGAPVGQRFSNAGMPTSQIGRLYHSTATLLPSGAVMIGGSNPNDDAESRPWPAEYRVEYLNPPYMSAARPTYRDLPAKVNYGTTFSISVTLPSATSVVKVMLMDLGFITHSVHMDQKAVELTGTLSSDRQTLSIAAPPTPPVYSPGPGWIFVLADGIPSIGQKLIIGTGASPPNDEAATANMLANSAGPISGPH